MEGMNRPTLPPTKHVMNEHEGGGMVGVGRNHTPRLALPPRWASLSEIPEQCRALPAGRTDPVCGTVQGPDRSVTRLAVRRGVRSVYTGPLVRIEQLTTRVRPW